MLNTIKGMMLARWTVRNISNVFGLSKCQARMFQMDVKSPEHCIELLQLRNILLLDSGF